MSWEPENVNPALFASINAAKVRPGREVYHQSTASVTTVQQLARRRVARRVNRPPLNENRTVIQLADKA